MCILCVIQKWSRKMATMLPWLVIPLIGLWALSQLLPPAFRFEITSPRLACVFVLFVTLSWYEVIMPSLSDWRVRRNARLREKKRVEAIELQKLMKTATRRCRNCLNPYREQNPGGGKFMCSYCGHISKRPFMDLPIQPGLGFPNSGILNDLVGRSGKIFNGKFMSDNGSWMYGEDWLDNGYLVDGLFPVKNKYWRKRGGVYFRENDRHLAKKCYYHFLLSFWRALTAFLLSIVWVWRYTFKVGSSGDDASVDQKHRSLAKKGENFQMSRGEKVRRKAEEKRQAKLEKEQLEEEERKQREEVSKLVEECRRSRDEKMESDKDRGNGSPPARHKDNKKELDRKRQEKKNERDRGSSKNNSDAGELEKCAGKDGEWNSKNDSTRRDHHRFCLETVKSNYTDKASRINGTQTDNYNRGSSETRYLNQMKDTGSNLYGKGALHSVDVKREHKSNDHVNRCQTSAYSREISQLERVSGISNVCGDDKNVCRPVIVEPQPYEAPKSSWLQLFTRSATTPAPSDLVVNKLNGKSPSEATSPSVIARPLTTQQYDPDALPECLPDISDVYADPCYVPDPVSLLGPVLESLDNFQSDLGCETDMATEKPFSNKSIHVSSEVARPSPIEAPASCSRRASSYFAPSIHKDKDVHSTLVDALCCGDENGTWQMWNSSLLGHDGLCLIGGPASSLFSANLNTSNKEDTANLLHQTTMAASCKNSEQTPSGTLSPQKPFFCGSQNGERYGNFTRSCTNDIWLPNTLFGQTLGSENHISFNLDEGTIHNEQAYGSPNREDWTVQGTHENTSNPSFTRPPVGGVYPSLDDPSIWSFD